MARQVLLLWLSAVPLCSHAADCLPLLPLLHLARPEAVAFFREKQQQALRWPPGSSSLAPQQLVVIDCKDPAVLVSSLPGNPGYPVPSQPHMDTLEVLVMRRSDDLPEPELRLHCLHNLTFVDIRGLAVTQLQLGKLPSLKVLMMTMARYAAHRAQHLA